MFFIFSFQQFINNLTFFILLINHYNIQFLPIQQSIYISITNLP
jgi:hypothetical protein